MIIDEGNVFLFAGITETDEAYHGAVALYDYLWVLKPELRIKLIKSWIKTLEKTLEEGVLEDVAPEYANGEGIVFVSEEPIEIRKIPSNVVEFPRGGRRNVERVEKKANESEP